MSDKAKEFYKEPQRFIGTKAKIFFVKEAEDLINGMPDKPTLHFDGQGNLISPPGAYRPFDKFDKKEAVTV